MGDNWLIKVLVGVVAAIALALLIWFLFFNKPEIVSGRQTQYRADGTSFNVTNVNTAGSTNKTVNNAGNTTNLSSTENAGNTVAQSSSTGGYSSSALFVNVSETQSTYLTKKAGSTLSFAAQSPDEAKKISPLKASGYSASGGGSGANDKGFCIAVLQGIKDERGRILKLSEKERKIYILGRLRYIPNFGAVSILKQEELIEKLIEELKNKGPDTNIAQYCDDIKNAEKDKNAIYAQCIAILDDIVTKNERDPAKIREQLNKITGFAYIKEEDVVKVVGMIVDGITNNNLSKESICSLIKELIMGGFEKMAIYKQCIKIVEGLSSIKPLNEKIILQELAKIPGFSSLTLEQKSKIAKDILEDPRTNGMLDAERHCTNIVSQILENILNSVAYQKCLLILEDIANNKYTSIAAKLKEIPGFSLLRDSDQSRIVQMVQAAADDGSIKSEETRKELCRNIAALILDALSGNAVYQQCIKTIDGIISGGPLNKEGILKKLDDIPGFQLADATFRNKKAEEVLQLLEDAKTSTKEQMKFKISEFCIKLTEDLSGMESALYKQCIKIIDQLSSVKETLNEKIILEYLNKISGFSIINEEDKKTIVQNILKDPREGGKLNAPKHCADIVGKIEGNPIFQKCLLVLEKISKDGIKDATKIETELLEIPGFKILTPEVKKTMVDLVIKAINDGTIKNEEARKEICRNIVGVISEGLNNNAVYQKCIKTIDGIISGGPLNKEGILKKLDDIPGFQLADATFRNKKAEEVLQLLEDAKTSTKEQMKFKISEFCIKLAEDISGMTDQNLNQNCVKIVEGIFAAKKNSNATFVLKELNRMPSFKVLSDDIKRSSVNEILGIKEPNIKGKIELVCRKITDDSENLGPILQCVKSIFTLVLDGNQGKIRSVMPVIKNISKFKDQPEKDLEPILIKIADLPDIMLDKDGKINNERYQSIIINITSICEAPKPEREYEVGKPQVSEILPNENNNQKEPVIPETSNLVLVGDQLYSQCAILNKIILDNFIQKSNAANQINQNAQTKQQIAGLDATSTTAVNTNNTAWDNAAIDDINSAKLGNNFYIPQQHTKQIEQELIDNFSQFLKEGKNDWKDFIINLGREERTVQDIIVGSNIQNFSGDKRTTLHKSLTERARITMISRVYRDMEFILKEKDIKRGELRKYIVELGKCTQPKKDFEYWITTSAKLKRLVQGIKELPPSLGFSGNRSQDPNAEIRETPLYKYIKESLDSPEFNTQDVEGQEVVVENFTNSLRRYSTGFKIMDKEARAEITGRYAYLMHICSKPQKKEECVEGKNNFTLSTTNKIIKMEQETDNFAAISGCYKFGDIKLETGKSFKEFAEFEPENQSFLAEDLIQLTEKFQNAAMEKRAQIVGSIWAETKEKNKGKPINDSLPISPERCEQIINETWSLYDQNSLQALAADSLDSLRDALEQLSRNPDNIEAMKNYTAPPSKKCKCSLQKIYDELHTQTVANFNVCRSGGDSALINKVRTISNIYIFSREQYIQSLSGNNPELVGKNLCMILFNNITDIANDMNETNKFLSDNKNEVTLNQICVQQLRDIYNLVSTFKAAYSTEKEIAEYEGKSCSSFLHQ